VQKSKFVEKHTWINKIANSNRHVDSLDETETFKERLVTVSRPRLQPYSVVYDFN